MQEFFIAGVLFIAIGNIMRNRIPMPMLVMPAHFMMYLLRSDIN